MLDRDKIQHYKNCAGIQDNPDQEGIELFAELIYKDCMLDKVPTFKPEVTFLNNK
jgi:hypothetical protein